MPGGINQNALPDAECLSETMNAREIEIFCTIMRCRTLSAAAEQLHVTQPALSKALRHCEDRLGYRLFHRIGGRLNPTAEANMLLPAADDVFRKMRSFSIFSGEIGGRTGGVLRVGATSSLASSIVPRAVARLKQEAPGAFVVLQMLAMPELEHALSSRRVDLGIALSPIMAPARESIEITRVPCVVLTRRDHPLAQRAFVTMADLAGLPEVGFGAGQDFGRSVMAAFRDAGVLRRLEVECGTTTTALALVRAGCGFAIVDGFTREYLPEDVVACRLEPAILRPMVLAQSPGSGTPALTDRFEAILTEMARDQP